MAIKASGHFSYRAVLHARGDCWTGRADQTGTMPGLAGNAPEVTLCGEQLTLLRMDDPAAYPPRYYGPFGVPMRVSYEIGDFVRAHGQEGDALHVFRGVCGGLGVQLLRDDQPVIALGVLSKSCGGLTTTPSPITRNSLPSDTQTLVVAVAGGSPIERLQYADVDPLGFSRVDPYLRFHYDGRCQDVAEGSDAVLSPWRIAVRRVRAMWRDEQVGAIRSDIADGAALLAAIRRCCEAHMNIEQRTPNP